MRRSRSSSRRARSPVPWSSALAVLLTAAVLPVLWSASPALAHTSLVSSTPGSSDVVVDPVDVVTLVFSQPVSTRQVRVVVSGPDGADVGSGPARVSGGTVSRSVGAWPAAGTYRLAYRVLAEDGHPITGQVPFSVRASAVSSPPAGAPATADPPPSPEPAEATGPAEASGPAEATGPAGTSNVVPALVGVLGAVAVLLVVGAVRAGRRRGADR